MCVEFVIVCLNSRWWFMLCSVYTGSSKGNAGIVKKTTARKLLTYRHGSSVKLLKNIWSCCIIILLSYITMFRYVLHMPLGRYRDHIRSRAKSAETYLALPLRWLLWSYPVGAGDPECFHHTQCSWRIPTKKKSIGAKIWASGRPEYWSAPPNPGVGELLIQGFAHRLAKMGRCYPPSTEHIQNLRYFAEF
jgi:hypothetical protein